jgi:tetratricopeptide (TPR) repeat protein
MLRLKQVALALCCFVVWSNSRVSFAENEGLEDLDKATQLKVTAESLDDLNEVVDRLETALEKGLDDENTKFAKQLLVAALLQRGNFFTTAAFNLPSNDAQQRLRSMQFRQFALNDLQRAVQLDEKLWEAHLQIGKLQTLADANTARRALSQVVDAADAPPEQKAEALALRSTVQRDDDRKMADINRAVELMPESPDYVRLRAQHFYSEEKFNEALADIDRALELESDHAASNELRGMILLGLERYDDALKSFDRASELAPEATLPYQHRAELYQKKGDSEKAIEQLTKALELAPDNINTLLLRARIHYEMKQTDRALEDIEKAIQLQPQLATPHLMKVEILAASERIDEAIEQLEELLKVAPGHPELLSRLGAFYAVDGKPRKAIESFSRVLEADSDNFRALLSRADVYLNIGEHEDAIADFERAISQEDDDEHLLNNFAWVLATSPDDDLRDGKRAVELATKAAEQSNYETPHILSTLAAAYAETGDFENAKKWSAKSVELAQKALESAESDEERERLKKELEQLQKELTTFEDGKPVRERQAAEEEESEDEDRSAAIDEQAPATYVRVDDLQLSVRLI